MKFECDLCGLCCRNIRLSYFYKPELDRGDGICKNLLEDNRCKIYNDRPIVCNVDAYYEKYLSKMMSRQQFYAMNYKMCAELKEIDRQK